jgi:hypothetical protein
MGYLPNTYQGRRRFFLKLLGFRNGESGKKCVFCPDRGKICVFWPGQAVLSYAF